jgi:hypothetical protein
MLAGFLKAFGDNSGYIQAVTLVDNAGVEAGGASAAQIGAVNETAPASDTASSGLNGRLQRIAQRLTTLVGLWTAATGTKTSVNSGAASVTILAANTARKGATVTNTDANILYLDLSGGTASTTSHTVAVPTGSYYEAPFGYTGLITGIWAADGSGAALVTEFS